MKKLATVACLLAATPAFAQVGGNFRATLSGYDEVPSVHTRAQGTFAARVNGASIDYTLTYSGLQAPVTQAHIHFSKAGTNGAIMVWLCGTATLPGPTGTPLCPGTGGTVSGTFTSDNVLASPPAQQFPASDLEALIDAMLADSAYVNVHSTVSQGGEIRGQVNARGNSPQ